MKENQIGNWKVVVVHKGYAFFENQISGCEGGIWLEGKIVVDYDGVFELPKKVVQALQGLGYSFKRNILPEDNK